MPRGTRLTQAQRDQIAALHAAGHGRNEIARQVDCAVATVTKVAQDLGLSFDRAQMPGVAAGNVARQEDLKARRLALQVSLIEEAEKLRDDLRSGTWKTILRSSDGSDQPRTLDFVPIRDRKDAIWALGALVATDQRMEKANGDGLDDDRNMLARLDRILRQAETADA